MHSLTKAVRRFRDATLKEECRSDYPHALQAMLKALDRAEDLFQSQAFTSEHPGVPGGFWVI